MNQSDVRTNLTVKGHVGEFRLAWKSDFEPVLRVAEDGRRLGIEYFPTAKDAEIAAWRTMNKREQTAMVRSGETLTTSAADAHFIGLKPFARSSKRRRTEVSHVGGERV